MTPSDFLPTLRGLLGLNGHKYQPILDGQEERPYPAAQSPWSERRKLAIKVPILIALVAALGVVFIRFALPCSSGRENEPQACDTPESGYQCDPSISHFWGQYSPYFTVPSEISADTPQGCEITFVQILARHGARSPTTERSRSYNETIQHIQAQTNSYGKRYEFIRDYEYALGANDLSPFGQQQMINSGARFYERYRGLTRENAPFIRASGSDRVVESARNWTQGFHSSKAADGMSESPDPFPYDILVMSEVDGSNNTLSHNLCRAFESGPNAAVGKNAQAIFDATFIPAITARLNENLPGANLSAAETINMMDLCPFDTVKGDSPKLSQFCNLFTHEEWRGYDYHQSLGKWYGYGRGNPLGPTQGVGFANELVARLTGQPVRDHTSSNATLDGEPATFPLHRKLYADFTHDNDMTTIFSALGLYNGTAQLSNTTRITAPEAGGYAASWTVPFAARMYVEKMQCAGHSGELLRVLVNDRVVPLQDCGADELGRCPLDEFVSSLGFVRNGGLWSECFL